MTELFAQLPGYWPLFAYIVAAFFVFMAVFLLAVVPHLSVILTSFAQTGSWYQSILPRGFTGGHYSQVLVDAIAFPSVVRSIEYALTGSDFESAFVLYRVLRAAFPATYANRLRLRFAPLIKLHLENEFPRASITTRMAGLSAPRDLTSTRARATR